MAEIPAEAVQAAAQAMDRAVKHLSLDGGTSRAPGFSLAELAQVGLRAAAPFMAGERSDTDGVQAAPESTEPGEGAIPRVVGSSAHPTAPETLSALRERYIEAIRSAYDVHGDDERILDDRLADAVLAVRDDELAALRRELAYVADTGERWRRLWEQVGRERSDALVRAEQAETAVQRVRELHSEIAHRPGHCYCSNAYPCPTIRALDGPGAVSEEQTGQAGQ